jgi:hypothetical protein
MSRMRCVDGSSADTGAVEAQAVCEPASFQHRRNPDKTWPFLFSYKEDKVFVNRARRTTKADATRMVEDALF